MTHQEFLSKQKNKCRVLDQTDLICTITNQVKGPTYPLSKIVWYSMQKSQGVDDAEPACQFLCGMVSNRN
jgi:hypothetical protein